MDINVYCPSCRAVLRVPVSAAGKVARCPTCQAKFQVPVQQEDPGLEETVSSWIEQDVEDMQDEFDQMLQEQSERERVRKIDQEKEKERRAQDKMEKALQQREIMEIAMKRAPEKQKATLQRPDAPAADQLPPAPAPPVEQTPQRPDSPTQAAAPPVAPPAVTPPPVAAPPTTVSAAPVAVPPADQSVDDQPIELTDYPINIFADEAQPHLVVAQISQAGVVLAFDATFLQHQGFRLSMPERCAFSNEDDRHNLVAKPFVFFDQSQGEIRNAQVIEEGREIRLIPGMAPEQMLGLMRTIPQLPHTFKFPTPYYVSSNHTTMSVDCHTERREDGGVTCFVTIPSGQVALAWLANVNGISGAEYRLLRGDVDRTWSQAWQQIPEQVRQRLGTWVEFEAGESFQHYYSDAEFGVKDEGLAGIVLTDKRIIFHKYHRRGSAYLAEGPKLVLRPDGDFAGLTVKTAEGNYKAALFRYSDLEPMMAVMRDMGLDVEMQAG